MTSTLSLQITYRDGRPLAAYLYLDRDTPRRVSRTEEISRGLVVDLADDGSPVGLEILTPGSVTLEDVWGVFDRFGLKRPTASELRPLSAA